MGYVLGLASAMFYSLASILFRIGQRTRPDDDGQLVTNFVNAVLLGMLALFITWQPWSTSGFIALVAGGISGTVFGRFALLRGIRLVGPTRGGTFQAATPIPAAIAGWIILNESISVLEAVGGAISIFGLVQIIRSRATQSDASKTPLQHYLIIAAAPVFFAIAVVLRKWGLERLPGAVGGAFIGSAAGLVVMSMIDVARGKLSPTVIKTSMTEPAWPFIGAGVVSAAALITQFRALVLIEAWVIGILVGTVAIWTPFFSYVFLRGEETITVRLLGYIGVVFAGVVMIAAV
ncbi:MAG: drug/metabolite transporter (DMT)-like permease [Myxococcota bacterium]|jgi:drug/metabolite transporter (DMT)-like permease